MRPWSLEEWCFKNQGQLCSPVLQMRDGGTLAQVLATMQLPGGFGPPQWSAQLPHPDDVVVEWSLDQPDELIPSAANRVLGNAYALPLGAATPVANTVQGALVFEWTTYAPGRKRQIVDASANGSVVLRGVSTVSVSGFGATFPTGLGGTNYRVTVRPCGVDEQSDATLSTLFTMSTATPTTVPLWLGGDLVTDVSVELACTNAAAAGNLGFVFLDSGGAIMFSKSFQTTIGVATVFATMTPAWVGRIPAGALSLQALQTGAGATGMCVARARLV
jgi:hypothetical protein